MPRATTPMTNARKRTMSNVDMGFGEALEARRGRMGLIISLGRFCG
jgi:hypothetical protein